MKVEVTKGKALKNKVFIWGVQLIGATGKKLPAGTVEARTKSIALKKGKSLVRKRFRL